jgi:hypothetical protein
MVLRGTAGKICHLEDVKSYMSYLQKYLHMHKFERHHTFAAAILMDLSKAFDCLPHDLLLQKLKYYGTSKSALNLIQNYLSNRKQCVKLRTALSTWQDIYKGVPQISIYSSLLSASPSVRYKGSSLCAVCPIFYICPTLFTKISYICPIFR